MPAKRSRLTQAQATIIAALITILTAAIAGGFAVHASTRAVQMEISATQTAETHDQTATTEANVVIQSQTSANTTVSDPVQPTLIPTETLAHQVLTTIAPTSTIIPQPTNTQTVDVASLFMSEGRINFFMDPDGGGYCHSRIMPEKLDPQSGPIMIMDSWHTAPFLDFTFILDLHIWNTNPKNQWATLGNRITIKISTQQDVLDNVTIIKPLVCGAGGGIDRTFDPIELNSYFSSTEVVLKDAEFDYFSLEPGEVERFRLDLFCKTPGIYKIMAEIPFETPENSGTIITTFPTLECPRNFEAWSIDLGGYPYELLGAFEWDGSGYVQRR